MQGDALASGARSATFLPPSVGNTKENAGSGMTGVDVEKPKALYPCICGFIGFTAREFSDHVHSENCPA
jgi:hypothetical protein